MYILGYHLALNSYTLKAYITVLQVWTSIPNYHMKMFLTYLMIPFLDLPGTYVSVSFFRICSMKPSHLKVLLLTHSFGENKYIHVWNTYFMSPVAESWEPLLLTIVFFSPLQMIAKNFFKTYLEIILNLQTILTMRIIQRTPTCPLSRNKHC